MTTPCLVSGQSILPIAWSPSGSVICSCAAQLLVRDACLLVLWGVGHEVDPEKTKRRDAPLTGVAHSPVEEIIPPIIYLASRVPNSRNSCDDARHRRNYESSACRVGKLPRRGGISVDYTRRRRTRATNQEATWHGESASKFTTPGYGLPCPVSFPESS